MNAAHWHLVVNHFPIVAPFLGLIILIVGFVRKNQIVMNVAYYIFIFSAFLSFMASFTGDGAVDVISSMAGFNEDLVEQHEQDTQKLQIGLVILAILSGWLLYNQHKNNKYKKYVSYAVAVVSAICVLFLAPKAGNSGGVIMHKELRDNQATESSTTSPQESSHEEQEEMEEVHEDVASMKAGYEEEEEHGGKVHQDD